MRPRSCIYGRVRRAASWGDAGRRHTQRIDALGTRKIFNTIASTICQRTPTQQRDVTRAMGPTNFHSFIRDFEQKNTITIPRIRTFRSEKKCMYD